MKFLKQHIGLVLIVVLASILRFSIAGIHSYSNDELSAINRLRYDNFNELIEFGVMKGDMHPAGVQVFMKLWSTVFGVNEFAMRFPFVLCGILSVIVIYFLGLKWINKNAGLIAAGLLATLYFPVLHSELARPYVPGLLICLLIAWWIHKVLLSGKQNWKDSIILGVLFAAGMYTHYFAFLFVGFIGFTGLFFLKRENIKYYLMSAAVGMLLFLPHTGVTYYHLTVGGLQWLGPPDAGWLLQFLFFAFNSSWLLIGVLILFILISFFFRETIDPPKKKQLLLLFVWFFGIYILGHLMSVFFTPVLKFPVMLFAFPFLLLIIGWLISRLKFVQIATVLLVLITTTSTTIERDLFGNLHYGIFKEVSDHMIRWERRYGEGNIYTVYNLSNPDYMNFYAKQRGHELKFDWDVIEFADDYKIRKDLEEREEDYCIVGYSARLTLVNVFETVREFYPYVVEYEKFNNAAVFLMSRSELDEKVKLKEELVAVFPSEPEGKWNYNPDQVRIVGNTVELYELDATTQYGPEYRFTLSDFKGMDEKYLRISVMGMCSSDCQLTVTISGERNGEVIQHRGENFWIGHDLDAVLYSNDKGISVPRMAQYSTTMPDFLQEGDELKISFWNRNGEPVQIGPIMIYLVDNIWN